MSKIFLVLGCLILLGPAQLLAQEQPAAQPMGVEAAVALALANNPAILEATENLAAAQENAKAVRADSLPKLSTSYAYSRLADEPYANFNGNKVVVGARDNFAWDLKVKQPLFTGFAVSAQKRMAELGVDLGQVARELATLELIEQTKFAYYEILRQKQLLRVAEETVAQLAAHLDDASQFYDQALIPYNDLLKSQVALSNAEQSRVQSLSELEMAGARFNSLLKLPLDRPAEIVDLQPAPGSLPGLAQLEAQALRERPEIRALQLALTKSDQQISLARSAYFPMVDLEGIYGRNGDDPAASNNDYANDHNASVEVKATWTFFEWGKKRSELNRRIHTRGALEAQLDGLREKVRLEVKRSWLELKVADANIRTVENAKVQAEENYRITRLQYQQNLATSSDVLDAQTMLGAAESRASNSRYDFLRAQAAVDRALGIRNDESGAAPPADSPADKGN